MDGTVAPIPWQYHGSDGLQMWLWQTPHFVAKIGTEAAGFYWTVGDLVAANGGRPRPLSDGRTSDYATAERQLRETIGKSYPTVLGYRPYAGSLATTFRIVGGQFMDFGIFEGQHCVVSVALPDGTERGYSGYIKVVHYEIEVTQANGGAVRIMPTHIARVLRGSGRAAAPLADQWTGSGRIYTGSVIPGCTGRPGFLPETIDHAGWASCRIHESDQT
ncbi:MAG: hypothetical protein ABI903_05280 [Actinomycetota bacterium]